MLILSKPTAVGAPGHRYWRLWITVTAYGTAIAIAEVQYRTTPGTPLLFSNPANASAGSAYNGVGGGYDGTMAADNNLSTLWAGSALLPDWWMYDYGAGNAPSIKELTLTSRAGGYADQTPSQFTLQYSDDGSTFTNVQTFTSATWPPDSQTTQVFTLS